MAFGGHKFLAYAEGVGSFSWVDVLYFSTDEFVTVILGCYYIFLNTIEMCCKSN